MLRRYRSKKRLWVAVASGSLLLAGVWAFEGLAQYQAPRSGGSQKLEVAPGAGAIDSVTITDSQSKNVKVVSVQVHEFVSQREAVGFIDFNQDTTVQVFSPYQGRVRRVFAKAGDDVAKGQPLFSIDSPDLGQAESNLISTAGLLALTSRALERAKLMSEVQANSQKDLEQAISDQQTADGNYQAARDAVRIFGKTDAELDQIVASRKVDGELLVVSPFRGRVTARNVAPGFLAQPGTSPAPFIIADVSTMWMVANVAETDLPQLALGQVWPPGCFCLIPAVTNLHVLLHPCSSADRL